MSSEQTPLKIIAAGDIMLDDQHFCSGFDDACWIEISDEWFLIQSPRGDI